MIAIKHIYETQNYNKIRINLSKIDLFFRISVFFIFQILSYQQTISINRHLRRFIAHKSIEMEPIG